MSETDPANDRRIDYIELPVTDIAAAKRFYGDVFGWTFQDWGEAYTSFDDGRLSGGFRLAESVTTGGPLVVLYGLNLESLRDAVIAAGGGITKDIFHFPGGRRFQFTDPAGNELAVWSDRDADGSVIGHY